MVEDSPASLLSFPLYGLLGAWAMQIFGWRLDRGWRRGFMCVYNTKVMDIISRLYPQNQCVYSTPFSVFVALNRTETHCLFPKVLTITGCNWPRGSDPMDTLDLKCSP